MNIRYAQASDCVKIAQLHTTSIITGFLSTLGIPFLSRLYKTILRDKDSVLYVAECHGKVNAFVAGTVNTTRMYRRVLFKNFFYLGFPLLKKKLNIRTLKKIIETTRYGLNNDTETVIKPELLAIAVSEKNRGSGIGKELVNRLETFFIKHGVERYKVVTFSNDDQSNRFYLSCGFQFFHDFSHHGNRLNEYMKELS